MGLAISLPKGRDIKNKTKQSIDQIELKVKKDGENQIENTRLCNRLRKAPPYSMKHIHCIML